ncbi:hypothetical protein [Poseidonibacter sp.]|uniref:hypothetical protein n=1 Tax=Poseidonibacter sp. TaxID=2321188 RepID=UPI003C713E80
MNLYEVKIGKKYEVVKANNMMEVSVICEEKGFKDFRSCGMMSRSELAYHKENAPLLSDV